MRISLVPVCLAAISVVCFSCASTQQMTLRVQQPAPVSLPRYVKRVALVNRTVVDRKTRAVDVVDKIFSLETPALDREGATASIQGLYDELTRDGRFDEVVLMKDNLTTVNPTVFPSPLAWDTVQRVCADQQVDALFALELFDTDSKISYNAIPTKLNTPLGSVPAIEHEAVMLTSVRAGWRLYDPSSKTVLDEFPVGRHISYSGRGINPVAAANALIGRKEAVKEVGNQTGHEYALRIFPYDMRVARDFYIRGTGNFKVAKRRAEAGHWDSAAELWQQETGNGKRKVAGRACYNMAIINEINGNLAKAIEWAQKSYEDYNNRLALRYVHLLRDRQYNNDLLRSQQSGVALEGK